MAENVDIKAKLSLEDESKGALEHIKHGFESLKETASESAHEVLSFGRDVAAAFLGFELGGIIESVKSFGEEIGSAATQAEDLTKGLAGSLILNDEASDSFAETTKAAGELREELERTAIGAGVDSKDVIGSFEEMAARGGHSLEELKGITEQAVYAGRAVPGGFEAIAQGMSQLELGAVRATNPVVNLIKQTGGLHGSAKQIAAQLSKMAQDGDLEKAMKLGEDAIAKTGDRMKGAAPTFANAVASLKGIREQLFEKAGNPIIASLTPELEKLGGWLQSNSEVIKSYAEVLGQDVGEWVEEAAEEFKEGFEFLKGHTAEIKDGIREAMKDVKEAFGFAWKVANFIYEHRVEIGAAYGASKVASIAPSGASIASGLGTAGKFAGSAIGLGKKLFGAGAVAAEAGGAEAVAAAGGLGLLGAALIPLTAAVTAGYVAYELWDHHVKVAAQDLAAMQDAAERVTAGFGETEEGTKRATDFMSQLVDRGDEAGANILLMAEAAHEAAISLKEIADIKDTQQQQDNSDLGYALSQSINQDIKDKTGIGAAGKKEIHMDFSGSKFEIHQDYRDQDPDRVAILFKEGVAKAAGNRLQSNMGIPFG